jgi:DNA modification methylase
MSTTPLDAAREHLSRRLVSLDHSQTWRERAIISPLFDVADMVCRVGDHPDSLHYRADKSGDMVSAALRVRGVAFEQYAGIDSWLFRSRSTGSTTTPSASPASPTRSGTPMLRTEADLIRTLEGTWTLGELHRLVEDAGIAGRDGGYDRIQDGKHRYKRRVRSCLQHLKAAGRAEGLGNGTWIINGTRQQPERALLVLFGAPTDVELFLGDVETILQHCQEPIDLLVTDPPWGLRRQDDQGRMEHAYERDSSLVVDGYVDVPDDEYQEFTYRWVHAAAGRLAPRGGYLAVVTGPRRAARVQVAAEDAGLAFVNQVVVRRDFPLRTTRRFAHAHHVVTIMCTGRADSKTRHFKVPPELPKARSGVDYPHDVWLDIPKYERPGLLRYDNALAPELVSRVVRAFTAGDWQSLVADPFVGSGTTPVVCLRERRRFHGGDLNPEALRFTMARVLDEELHLDGLPLDLHGASA